MIGCGWHGLTGSLREYDGIGVCRPFWSFRPHDAKGLDFLTVAVQLGLQLGGGGNGFDLTLVALLAVRAPETFDRHYGRRKSTGILSAFGFCQRRVGCLHWLGSLGRSVDVCRYCPPPIRAIRWLLVHFKEGVDIRGDWHRRSTRLHTRVGRSNLRWIASCNPVLGQMPTRQRSALVWT